MSSTDVFLFALSFLISGVLAAWVRQLSAELGRRPDPLLLRVRDRELSRLNESLAAALSRLEVLEGRHRGLEAELAGHLVPDPDRHEEPAPLLAGAAGTARVGLPAAPAASPDARPVGYRPLPGSPDTDRLWPQGEPSGAAPDQVAEVVVTDDPAPEAADPARAAGSAVVDGPEPEGPAEDAPSRTPVSEHPVAGDPAAGHPVAGHPVAGDPAAGHSVGDDPEPEVSASQWRSAMDRLGPVWGSRSRLSEARDRTPSRGAGDRDGTAPRGLGDDAPEAAQSESPWARRGAPLDDLFAPPGAVRDRGVRGTTPGQPTEAGGTPGPHDARDPHGTAGPDGARD